MTATINPSATAVFRYPQGLASNGNNKNFYVADTENHCIWYVNRNNGMVYLVAGEPGVPGNVNGPGRTARLNQPCQLAFHYNGTTLEVEDYGNGGASIHPAYRGRCGHDGLRMDSKSAEPLLLEKPDR